MELGRTEVGIRLPLMRRTSSLKENLIETKAMLFADDKIDDTCSDFSQFKPRKLKICHR